jgi:putative DNA primase/helicase
MAKAHKVPVVDPVELAWFDLNDLGNAKRIEKLAGGRLVWIEGRQCWCAYTGKAWSIEDGARLALSIAQGMAEHIAAEADALKASLEGEADEGRAESKRRRIEALHKHARSSGNFSRIQAALSNAKALCYAGRDDFDQAINTINCSNRTLHVVPRGALWDVQARGHDPADRISRLLDVEFDGRAECPMWLDHLRTILPVPEVRAFFQRSIGYALAGDPCEQVFFILHGRGGDGKSTTFDVLRQVFADYARTAAIETFLHSAARTGAEATPDLARLAGDNRLTITAEPRAGASLDEGRIKLLTGTEPIPARELNQPQFEFAPRFVTFLQCNNKPNINGADDGIWRRIVVVEFPHQFGDRADKKIKRALASEAAGILNWALAGLVQYLEDGELIIPDQVKAATEAYRKSSNSFADWFAENIDATDRTHRTLSTALFENYKVHCELNSVSEKETLSATAFGRALGDKQIHKTKDRIGRIVRIGARLRTLREIDENNTSPEGEEEVF